MRVGTWNAEGRWSAQHEQLLVDLDCDIWLLTEVHLDTALDGFTIHRTEALMSPSKSWAAVATKQPARPEADPHFATAVAEVDGTRFLSSILPWRSCGAEWPGEDLAGKAKAVVETLRPSLQQSPVIWGGDWNQALQGPEYVGSLRGRQVLLETLDAVDLIVPTALLTSAKRGHRSIDHVAIPAHGSVTQAQAVDATKEGRRLSDHDAYLVEFSL